MNEEFATALSLLAIGMITVFVVLTLVVVTGNLLTSFVNRFIPMTADVPAQIGSASKVAAITAAVDTITKGKGVITSIEREK